MKLVFLGFLSGALIGGIPSSTNTTVGCTPAQEAILGQIESRVLADLKAGMLPEAIETDIAQLLAGQVGVDVVRIVNDAITLLIDGGFVPANLLPAARSLQTIERAKLTARGAIL